jgi:glutamate-1-semialdehyde 2,1-aminomutase
MIGNPVSASRYAERQDRGKTGWNANSTVEHILLPVWQHQLPSMGGGFKIARSMGEQARSTVDSEAAFLKAKRVMPGGVSSPVRAFKAVGGTPIFIREGEGAHLKDIDGNSYIDYVGSYGPLIAGHTNERVVAALSKAIGRGTSFGAPTELETQLATLIISALPAVEMVRFVNSGTEATMSAIRLARAATGRDLIFKCAGCYHGHSDGLLVQAGSGALTLGTPSSPGVPESIAAATIVAPYNDLEATRNLFHVYSNRIAGFIVEPVAGNMGVIPPAEGYLSGLRQLCDEYGAMLIFDEVMTGFRVAWGGAQVLYKIAPDLTCLGKTIGGGLPCAAYGGSRKLMEQVSPAGKVYQAGTLSGNPLAMAGGIATLEVLQEGGVYEGLEWHSAMLANGLIDTAAKANVPITINRVGSMLTPFFTKTAGQPVRNYADATSCDVKAYATFFHAMLEHGIYMAPSQFEAMFTSVAHTDELIEETIRAAETAFAAVAAAR